MKAIATLSPSCSVSGSPARTCSKLREVHGPGLLRATGALPPGLRHAILDRSVHRGLHRLDVHVARVARVVNLRDADLLRRLRQALEVLEALLAEALEAEADGVVAEVA